MSRIFGSDGSGGLRGCFIAFDIDFSGSQGAIVELPQTSTLPKLPDRESNASYPLVVTSVSLQQKDKTFFQKCFGDSIFTYAFGNSVGQVSVTFVAFLAKGVTFSETGDPAEPVNASAVIDFLNAYRSSRVSISKEQAKVSLGQNGSLTGFITEMQMRTMNTEANLQEFTLTLNTVEIQGDEDTQALGSDPTADSADQAAQNTGLTYSQGELNSNAAADVMTLANAASMNTASLGELIGVNPVVTGAARNESKTNREARKMLSDMTALEQNTYRITAETTIDQFLNFRGVIAGKDRTTTLKSEKQIADEKAFALEQALAVEQLGTTA